MFLFFSCQEDDFIKSEIKLDEITENSDAIKREFSGDSLILQNPYSIANMKLALNNLKNKNLDSDFLNTENFQINTTHLYVKFNPKNEEEEYLLKSDSTMHLFDYRLDVEYKDEYLNNRKLTNDSISDYYTAIPVNKILPNVPYEVIDELYIPEQDDYFKNTTENERYLITYKINNKTDLFNHLIFDAFVITNNEEEVIEAGSTETQRWFFGKRWRPKGILKIYDDVLKIIPLEGAKILMRQWFTIDSGISDANGYFQTGTVRGHARYIIQWERQDYSIRSGWFGQAELRGPKLKNQDWNFNIENGPQQYYGTIHNAAHYYFYKDVGGLRRPPHRAFFRGQIKFAAYLVNEGTNYNSILSNILPGRPWPTITMKKYQQSSSSILGTTFHELAHSTHARHRSILRFNQSESRMKETYAQTIEWYLTTKRYNEIRPDLGFVFESNYQFRSPQFSATQPSYLTYTSLMVDLIDGFNQRTAYGNQYVLDNVSGYSLNQIEDEVMQTKTFSELNFNLLNNYNNPTENNLTELFNNW